MRPRLGDLHNKITKDQFFKQEGTEQTEAGPEGCFASSGKPFTSVTSLSSYSRIAARSVKSLFLGLVNRVRTGRKSKATFYYAGSSLICQGLRFCGVVVSTSRLRPDDFGIFATAMMLLGLTSLAREFGQNSALLSWTGTQPAYIRTHFVLSLWSSGASMLIVLVAALAIPALHDLRSFWPLLVLQIFFDALTSTPMIVAQKKFAFRELAIVEISTVSSWLLITIVAIWFYPFAFALLIAKVGETAVRGTLLFCWQYRAVTSGKPTAESYQYYLKFAKLLAPKTWLETFGVNLDVLLLRIFTNNFEIGVFERTMQLLRVPLSLSVNLIDAVAGASYSREQGDSALVNRSLRRFALVILAGSLFGVLLVQIFLWILAGPFFGAGWKHSIEGIWIWAIPFAILRPFFWNYNLYFNATGQAAKLLASLCLATFLFLGLGLLAVPTFGVQGLLVALACTNLVALLFQIRWTRQSVTLQVPV
jgi:O-antigen/teichoic acid export membrane protein